jgi:hypothetical protein
MKETTNDTPADAPAPRPVPRAWIRVGPDPLRYEYGRRNPSPDGPPIMDALAYVQQEPSGYVRWETYTAPHVTGAEPSRTAAQDAALAALRKLGHDAPPRPASRYLYFRDATADGCVIALDPTMIRPDGMREGFAGTFDRPNSGVSWGALADASLGEPVTEAQARALHPALFARIDAEPDA